MDNHQYSHLYFGKQVKNQIHDHSYDHYQIHDDYNQISNEDLENPEYDQYENNELEVVPQQNVIIGEENNPPNNTEGYQTKQKRIYTNQRSINRTSPITKNVPKNLGKGFKKFLMSNETEFKLASVNEYLEFIDKENKNIRIETFNKIIQNKRLKILLEFYLENLFVIDLSHSKKIAPETYLPIIKTYLKGIKKGKIEGQISQ